MRTSSGGGDDCGSDGSSDGSSGNGVDGGPAAAVPTATVAVVGRWLRGGGVVRVWKAERDARKIRPGWRGCRCVCTRSWRGRAGTIRLTSLLSTTKMMAWVSG